MMFSLPSRLIRAMASAAGAVVVSCVTALVLLVSAVPAGALVQAGPLPLGTFEITSTKPKCPGGFKCQSFIVRGCTNLRVDLTGALAKAGPPQGVPVRGMAVFFAGSTGMMWWGSGLGRDLLQRLRDVDGLWTIEVKWDVPWYGASVGEDAGNAHGACRPATAIRWIYDTLYVPLHISPAPGACGFCITGNSGGAAAVAYALSHYGLDAILNGVFPTSGPTMSRLDKGCLPEYPEYNYSTWSTPEMDKPFGYFDPDNDPGPCMRHDPAEIPRWLEEGVVSGANDLNHPNTRIQMIIGGADDTAAPAQAGDYEVALEAIPTNHVSTVVIPGMVHTIQNFQEGVDALEAALLGSF
jgi:hypothetical protein